MSVKGLRLPVRDKMLLVATLHYPAFGVQWRIGLTGAIAAPQ
jgi:hypothetical protein